MKASAIASCIAGVAIMSVGAFPSLASVRACNKDIKRSCLSISEYDPDRVCNGGGAQFAACGDVADVDAQFNDITAADGVGKDWHSLHATFVTASYDKYFCNGGTCNFSGPQTITCEERFAVGDRCTGGGATPIGG